MNLKKVWNKIKKIDGLETWRFEVAKEGDYKNAIFGVKFDEELPDSKMLPIILEWEKKVWEVLKHE